MAHPKRKAEAEALAAELRQYPFTEVTITWDQINQEWDTGKRSLEQGIGKGDWHLVIQDDAVLTPHFYDNLTGALAAAPARTLISLYVGQARPLGKRVKIAVDKAYHATWLRFNMLTWGVGIILPSDHIEPLLDFVCDPHYDVTPYDVRVGMFYTRNMLPVLYTMPSLVDHCEQLGSLLDHDESATEPRVAHRTAAGLVSWNRHIIDI